MGPVDGEQEGQRMATDVPELGARQDRTALVAEGRDWAQRLRDEADEVDAFIAALVGRDPSTPSIY